MFLTFGFKIGGLLRLISLQQYYLFILNIQVSYSEKIQFHVCPLYNIRQHQKMLISKDPKFDIILNIFWFNSRLVFNCIQLFPFWLWSQNNCFYLSVIQSIHHFINTTNTFLYRAKTWYVFLHIYQLQWSLKTML